MARGVIIIGIILTVLNLYKCSEQMNAEQTVSFTDYFPLKKDTLKVFYVSHIIKLDSTKNKLDTIKDKNKHSFCRSVSIKGKELFYFEDEEDSSDTVAIIGSQSFCGGVFYFENKVFFFSPIFWKQDLMHLNINHFEALFPATISIATIYKWQDGIAEKKAYKFTRFEDVIIKNKVLKNCLKLIVTKDYIDEQDVDTVWFQKRIGVVKWLRSTGRLEEIKL